jgi:hypothetical protein
MKRAFCMSSLSVVAAAVLLILLVPSADVSAQASASTVTPVQRWEYRVVTFSSSRNRLAPDVETNRARNKDSETALNELGALGWELISVRENPRNDPVYYFKRPVR